MELTSTPSPFELLAFYVEAGVDEAIGTLAINRFQHSPPTPPVTAQAQSKPAPALSSPAYQAPVSVTSETSMHLAESCTTLAELRSALENFEGLSIKHTAMNMVFADGNPHAPVMLIGEAPGHDEDVQGLPFVGKSGKMLDRMLASIDLRRTDNAYITNVLPWRPVENRTPSLEEIALCRPFLMRHIHLVAPKVLVLLGGVPASTVLETSTGITRLRGQWHSLTVPGLSAPIPTIATFHPSYLLRTPAGKRMAWRDLLDVKKRLTP